MESKIVQRTFYYSLAAKRKFLTARPNTAMEVNPSLNVKPFGNLLKNPVSRRKLIREPLKLDTEAYNNKTHTEILTTEGSVHRKPEELQNMINTFRLSKNAKSCPSLTIKSYIKPTQSISKSNLKLMLTERPSNKALDQNLASQKFLKFIKNKQEYRLKTSIFDSFEIKKIICLKTNKKKTSQKNRKPLLFLHSSSNKVLSEKKFKITVLNKNYE